MKRIRILVLILCACFVSAASGQEDGWSEFHRPDMTRWNPGEHVLNVNNVGSLTLKWDQPEDNEWDSPIVANGVV